MKRKVIKQANQAYTITLPIEWVRDNNINEKSELELSSEGKSLVISNTKETSYKKITIDVTNEKGRSIGRIITSLYSKGIDEIELKSDKDISGDIIESLRNTIGYALIHEKDNKFIIKDIGGTNYNDLDEIFKRVFQMILSFHSSAINDIFGEEKESIETLSSRDKEINKFCYFLQRAINKMSYKDPITGRTLFTYSYEIEKIGDEIQRLWRVNIKYQPKKSLELKKLAHDSLDSLEKAFEFFFQFNIKKAEELAVFRDKIREKSMEIKGDKYSLRMLRHILKIIEETADLSQLTFMIKLT